MFNSKMTNVIFFLGMVHLILSLMTHRLNYLEYHHHFSF